MGSMSLMHWVMVLAIVLVLFGAGKLPRVMGDFAKGIKAFKAGMKEPEDEAAAEATPPASPAAGGHRHGRRHRECGRLHQRAQSARLSRRAETFGWPQRRRGTSAGPTACCPPLTVAWRSATTRLKGRGVFARAALGAGALIEAAPVMIVPADQRKLLDHTILHDYYFHLGRRARGESRGAVALGLVSLCNHSRRPSARVRRNRARETLDLLALTPIAAGNEITIDYNCPLWFAAED